VEVTLKRELDLKRGSIGGVAHPREPRVSMS
jgi:hypothetical protein